MNRPFYSLGPVTMIAKIAAPSLTGFIWLKVAPITELKLPE